MKNYGMNLIAEGREISIPVLPAKLKVTSPGKNDTTTVLELGEVLILRKKGLRSVAWDSFFPVNDAPFVTGRITDPPEIVQAIQKARDKESPIRFLITGTDLDINVRMGVETFDYEERAGEPGDFYYSIKLSEWKDYSAVGSFFPPRRRNRPRPRSRRAPDRRRPPRKDLHREERRLFVEYRKDVLWQGKRLHKDLQRE
jgi:hypothetical protein